ncbi:hypothetical protein K3728_12655 [Rhodobacteraceae bacterium M385]|nr:hypothetical protein K3728_12655 [Rhodobacteraceae bacterium M385]
MKTIQAKAGKSTKILSKFSNSSTRTYSFSASPVSGEDAPSGTVEVKGSNWIFPGRPTFHPLKANNIVTKSMWNVSFKVFVIPEQDVNIETKFGKKKWPLLIAAVVIGIVGVAAAIIMISAR